MISSNVLMNMLRSIVEGRSALAPKEEHHIRTLCGGAGYEQECLTIRNDVVVGSKQWSCSSSNSSIGCFFSSSIFCFSHDTLMEIEPSSLTSRLSSLGACGAALRRSKSISSVLGDAVMCT